MPQFTDTQLLDWWENNTNYEHAADYESGYVVMFRVSGNVNDRVWDKVACEPTLREAIAATINSQADKVEP